MCRATRRLDQTPITTRLQVIKDVAIISESLGVLPTPGAHSVLQVTPSKWCIAHLTCAPRRLHPSILHIRGTSCRIVPMQRELELSGILIHQGEVKLDLCSMLWRKAVAKIQRTLQCGSSRSKVPGLGQRHATLHELIRVGGQRRLTRTSSCGNGENRDGRYECTEHLDKCSVRAMKMTTTQAAMN